MWSIDIEVGESAPVTGSARDEAWRMASNIAKLPELHGTALAPLD